MSFWVYVLCVFIRKRKEVFFPDEIEVSMWMSAWATKSTAVVIEFLQAHTHQLRPCILDQNAWAWGASAPQKFHHQCVSWIGRCIRIDKCPNTATRARAYITYVQMDTLWVAISLLKHKHLCCFFSVCMDVCVWYDYCCCFVCLLLYIIQLLHLLQEISFIYLFVGCCCYFCKCEDSFSFLFSTSSLIICSCYSDFSYIYSDCVAWSCFSSCLCVFVSVWLCMCVYIWFSELCYFSLQSS